MSNSINVNVMTSYYNSFIKSVMAQTSVDKGSANSKETVTGDRDSFISTLSSKDSFLIFLESLAKDYDENHDEWENWTISDYLERISAWIKDSDENFETIDFKKMAEIFYVGKVAELACGYGGGVGALKAMGALEMGLKEEELQPLVTAWRNSNPNIVKFWWAVDNAVMTAIKERTNTETHGLKFTCRSGMLFIALPSGRKLAYLKPHSGINQLGGESVTYEGIGATKKWERLENYGPKFVENIVQAIARDILCYAMKTLRHCSIVMHIHDEVVIEAVI